MTQLQLSNKLVLQSSLLLPVYKTLSKTMFSPNASPVCGSEHTSFLFHQPDFSERMVWWNEEELFDLMIGGTT